MRLFGGISDMLNSGSGSAHADTSRVVDRLIKRPRFDHDLDPLVVWPALALMMIGLVMVFSASIAIAEGSALTRNQPYFYLVRQAVFILIGLMLGFAAFRVSMRQWQHLAPYLFMFGILLLLLVFVPGIGREVNGAYRWIPIGPINLQPSELMKVFVVLYAADYTVRKLPLLSDWKHGLLPMVGVILLAGFPLIMQPDFGALVIISVITCAILFFGGISLRIFGLIASLALAGFVALILVTPYRLARVLGFLNPWDDPLGKGYQLTHSLIAFGRGEILGVGLGGSVEKLFYLPEAHTDFILAVIAEELGFVGVSVIVVLFAVLIHRAFAIAREAVNCERYFSGLVAMGTGVWLGVQSFINMGVNMGLLPTKGLTLPLMSYGGSAMMSTCLALAILLRVDWENRQLKQGKQV